MSVKYFECDNGLRLNVDKYFITGAIAVSVVSPTVLSKKKLQYSPKIETSILH